MLVSWAFVMIGCCNATVGHAGEPNLDRSGTRAVPGLTYLSFRPVFAEHFHEADDEGDESINAGPTGGLGWSVGCVIRLMYSLRDVVTFYVERNSASQEWYPLDRTGGVRNLTTCQWFITTISVENRHSTGILAMHPWSQSRRSKISSVSYRP